MVSTHFFGDTRGSHIFFYNLQGNVGKNSPNRIDDVQLVQLGLRSAGQTDTTIDPETRSFLRQVPWGPGCTGTATDPLVIAIRRYQVAIGAQTQDDHISVVTTHDATVPGQKRFFHLIKLQTAIIQQHKGKWPLINAIDGCPEQLKAQIAGTMSQGGTPGAA